MKMFNKDIEVVRKRSENLDLQTMLVKIFIRTQVVIKKYHKCCANVADRNVLLGIPKM